VKLDVPTLARLSPLMDEALELEDGQLTEWLSHISASNADLIPALRELLSKKASVQTSDILQRGPDFTAPGGPIHLSEFKADHTVGPYRLLRELGRGGMGEVWLAERIDGSLKRQVALKLPHSSLPQRQLAERFARERDILSSLVHPNIARLYDAGVTPEGQPYLALEYVEGEMLATWCDARKLGIKARITLFRQVFAAVEYAHRQLVLHRDIKPTNIMVTAAGEVRLLDFGIAKLMTDGQAHETELTQLGGRALSLQYASPEQILGQPLGTTSDVYSLGVVLHEVLTGSLPYRLQRGSNAAIEEAVLSSEPSRAGRTEFSAAHAKARGDKPRHLRVLLKGDIETILQKSLKKRATERYGSAQAFADDFERFLNGEPVLAQPDSRWYRTAKFLRRNWLATGAGAAVVVSLAAGLAVALWQANAARQEAQTARAVQAFLLDIFQANSSNQSDPQKARNTTARELLDIGAKKIDNALGAAPEAKLQLLATLGQLYVELGLNAQAADMHRKRVIAARQVHGKDSIEVATALMDLAFAVNTRLDDPEWQRSLAEAESILDRHGEADSLLRASLLIRLADYYQEKDMSKANGYADAALSIYRKYPPSRDFVSALFSAATVRMVVGDYAQSLAVIEEAIAAAQGPVAKTSADFLPNLYSYQGDVKKELGDLPGADTGLREGWTRSESLNGDDHIDTITNLAEYAHLLASSGKSAAEGIQHLTRTVDALKRANGGDEPANQWIVLTRYGTDSANYGQLEEGLAALVRLQQLLADGGNSWRLGSVLVPEADILVKLGRYAEADRLLDDAHKMLPTEGIARSKFERIIQITRFRLLLAEQRNANASTLAAKLSFDNIDLGVQISDGMTNRYLQAKLALALGNASRAQELAQQSVSVIEDSRSKAYLAVAEQQFRVVSGKAFLSMNRAVSAEPMLRQALELGLRVYDPLRSPELADTQIALAEALLDLKRPVEARVLASTARAVLATHKELGEQYRQPMRALEARLAGMRSR
jgi:serine/threonine-protein kinase